MNSFQPCTIHLRGQVLVKGAVDEVFPLFSPEGERLWVPGWNPAVLFPPDSEWQEGQIFRTQEELGEAVWLITRLDRALRSVQYHRVEPGRYVARIEVGCRAMPNHGTEASIAYSFIGLSEDGNREIAEMTQQAYDAKMTRWTEWIEGYLAARERGSDD
jgi:hypothetical protein